MPAVTILRPSLLFAAVCLAVPLSASAAPPSHPINPDAPWALALDDELSKPLVEQWYGEEVAEQWRTIEPHWEGNQLLTRDSFDEQMLSSLGVPPLPAMNYDPSPGVVFVAMDGVTLTPSCGNGDSAHSALNCTPLVDAETTFPAFGAQAAADFQQLRGYYEPFDIIMTSTRPPDFVPYTMTVIGGSAGQVGLGGACGVANVACDGLKRNHVSLNFPQSCNGMAETAGQETAHNWGLEHTDNPSDILYPFNNGGVKSFVDSCMAISHETGNGITACGYIHEIYCPDGAGEQQNSYAEMLGVFGPKTPDESPPQIVSTYPEDGDVIEPGSEFTVTASIEENSRTTAVKWTWLEGLPEGTESYTRCTNNICDDNYNVGVSFDASEVAWDFLGLNMPPEGEYSMMVEAYDVYGNYDSRTITFVVGEAAADDGADDTGGGGDDDDDDDGDDDDDDDDDGTGGDGGADGGDDGGGCRVAPTPAGIPLALFGLLLIGARRRD